LIFAYARRIRKKARYQELLDCETRLGEIQEAEKLQSDRLTRIQRFLAVREIMLNDLSNSPTTVSMKAFDNTQLQNIVVPEGLFLFAIHDWKNTDEDSNIKSLGSNEPSTYSSRFEESLSRMCRWDRRVRERAEGLLLEGVSRQEDGRSSSISTSVKYEIAGGVDGIAISKDGHGYLRAGLVCQTENSAALSSSSSSQLTLQSRTLLTGMLDVQFEVKSSRVAAATWTTLHDCLPFNPPSGSNDGQELVAPARDKADPKIGDDPSSSSSETLGNQLVHPSVVSLDHEKANMDAEDSQGPGMEIS
jgi:hypothetical protein